MDAVVRDAIDKAEQDGIVFIDEIDKIAAKGAGSGPDVSREGVQRDILPIVEGSVVSTKYGPVRTNYMLFIAAGAFHVSKINDLIPELQGRFPIVVKLNALTTDDYERILTAPQNAITKQYAHCLKRIISNRVQTGGSPRRCGSGFPLQTKPVRISVRGVCTQ